MGATTTPSATGCSVSRGFGAVLAAAGVAVLVAPVAGAAVSVSARAEPTRVSLGTPFTYIVEATFDDPAATAHARIVGPPGAFDPIGRARVEHSGRTVRLTQRLACLGLGCVAGAGRRRVALPMPRVILSGGRVVAGRPLAVTVVPRVPAAAVAARTPVYRRQTELPPPDFRTNARAVGVVAATVAVALLVASAAIVLVELRRRRRPRAAETDELVRAARLVRESAKRASSDRRRAAGLLGRVARGDVEPGLAAAADRTAWSRSEPDEPAALRLADKAEAHIR